MRFFTGFSLSVLLTALSVNVGASPTQRPREDALSYPQPDIPQPSTTASSSTLDAQELDIDRRNHHLPVISTPLPDLFIDSDFEARGLKHHGSSTPKPKGGKTPDKGDKKDKDDGKKPKVEKTPIYHFSKKWKFTDSKDETAPGEHTLQKELSYDHIGLIIAKVTKKETKKATKSAPATIKYDVVDAKQLDMIIKEGSKEHEVESRNLNWRQIWQKDRDSAGKKTLQYVGPISGKMIEVDKGRAATKYIKEHPKYSAKDNSCKTFVQNLDSRVK